MFLFSLLAVQSNGAVTSKNQKTTTKTTSASKSTVAAKSPAASAKVTKARTTTTRTTSVKATTKKPVTSKAVTAKPATATVKSTSKAKVRKARTTRRYRVRRVYNPWDTPTYADSTWGDEIDGEDLAVRRAAVQALGPYNGAVVVSDANTGRVLTIVNQKLAISSAYQPCSTIKLVATLAALNEGLIDRSTTLRLSRRERLNLTEALARSNNPYFSRLGEWLGWDKVREYATLFGLGERAGLNIRGETPGLFPTERPKGMSVGIMTSYGEGISVTALQLTALAGAIANGGTMHYLQYPRSQAEIETFTPRVRRELEMPASIAEIRPGMMGTVDFGSGRRAAYSYSDPLLGKTGTCSDGRTHLGWFVAFNEFGRAKLAITVMLTGGAPVKGPVAAGIAGQFFRNLADLQYFAADYPAVAAQSSVLSLPLPSSN